MAVLYIYIQNKSPSWSKAKREENTWRHQNEILTLLYFMYERIMRKWGGKKKTKRKERKKKLGKILFYFYYFIFLCVIRQSTCCSCSTSVTSIIKYKWRVFLLLLFVVATFVSKENIFMNFKHLKHLAFSYNFNYF